MIGARVIKTSLAVSLSILVARSLNLYTPQFAGIISVLSVQPSIYRSFRHGIQQVASAMMGAVLGAWALYVAGRSFLVMGVVSFLLMFFHVKIKWTNSLLVSVVIAINTMGTPPTLSFMEAAWNQMALVLVGIGIGTFVNLLQKPMHYERAEDLLTQSEAMLRALLHFMFLNIKENRCVPYPLMKEQIDHVRKYIEKGKEISLLINEDQKIGRKSCRNTLAYFHSLESGVERIRDMVKALQGVTLLANEIEFVKKAILISIAIQEKGVHCGKNHGQWMRRILESKRNRLFIDQVGRDDFANRLAFYNFYGYLKEYLEIIEGLHLICVDDHLFTQWKVGDGDAKVFAGCRAWKKRRQGSLFGGGKGSGCPYL